MYLERSLRMDTPQRCRVRRCVRTVGLRVLARRTCDHHGEFFNSRQHGRSQNQRNSPITTRQERGSAGGAGVAICTAQSREHIASNRVKFNCPAAGQFRMLEVTGVARPTTQRTVAARRAIRPRVPRMRCAPRRYSTHLCRTWPLAPRSRVHRLTSNSARMARSTRSPAAPPRRSRPISC